MNSRLLCVDDGSTDGTAELVEKIARRDKRIQLVELSRNFGHQAALTAGLAAFERGYRDHDGWGWSASAGAAPADAGVGDAGVRHRPGPTRRTALASGGFKQWSSGRFYQFLNLISGTHVLPGAADFRALSRQAVDALNSMPEYHRFLRGMISWMGFRSVILPYHETERIAGRSKYSLSKMIKLALDAVFSFSLAPLYVGLSLGGVLLCLAVLEMAYVLSFWISGRTGGLAPGWSSLMFVILVVGAMLMLLLGFVGVYVGYIFQEVKRRPVFLTRKTASQSRRLR